MTWLPDFSAWRWYDFVVLALLFLGPVGVLVWVLREGGGRPPKGSPRRKEKE